jgi:hypothetical protein
MTAAIRRYADEVAAGRQYVVLVEEAVLRLVFYSKAKKSNRHRSGLRRGHFESVAHNRNSSVTRRK